MNEITPSFLKRSMIALRGMRSLSYYAVTGQWEGWETSRVRNRPSVRLVSQDTDLDYGVREKMLAEARSLCQTVGVCNAILGKYADYVVGGLKVKWLTDDEEWNEQSEQSWCDWMPIADFRQKHSFPMIVRMAVKSSVRDGDQFFQEVDENGFYQLQPIEADRVTGGPHQLNRDLPNLVGGVRVDNAERPLGYMVWERTGRGGFANGREIPANRIIHVWDPDRFDAQRGVTAFKTALNHLRDWKETLQAEKTAQKAASKLAILVKNAIGGPFPGAKNVFGADETTAESNTVKTEEIADGVIQYLLNGDSMEAFMSQRPGDGFFKLAELLLRDIAIGLELPFEFVWNMAGLSGPGVRMMSKQAERVFIRKQDALEFQMLNRVVMRKTAIDMQAGRLPFNPQFRMFKIQRPPHISIDAGRDSAADLNELDAGVTSYEILADKYGQDAWDVLRSKARTAKWAVELSEEFGVPVDMILRTKSPVDSTQQQAARPPQEEEEEERREPIPAP